MENKLSSICGAFCFTTKKGALIKYSKSVLIRHFRGLLMYNSCDLIRALMDTWDSECL